MWPRLCTLGVTGLLLTQAVQAASPLSQVDPTIGNVGVLLEPTRPTVQWPNAMVRVYPVRRDAFDESIDSFPMTLIGHRMGELFGLMPAVGSQDGPLFTRRQAYDSVREILRPHYLSTILEESGIRVEFTPGQKTGIFRITYPAGSKAALRCFVRHGGQVQLTAEGRLEAVEEFEGMKAFLVGQIVKVPAGLSVHQDTNLKRAWYSFDGVESQTLELRYGISWISHEQAAKNLAAELPAQVTFDSVVEQAQAAWEKVLGRIEVTGGTPAQQRTFYTALYRTHERMVNITEDGHYYSGFDHQVHQDARPFYNDDWIWDTHLAHHPLTALLTPQVEADRIASYVRMYQQGTWMPTFPQIWGNHKCMTGNHVAAIVSDALAKGIKDFDLEKAYEGLRKNALQKSLLPWKEVPATALDEFHAKNGYFPALNPGEVETEKEVHHHERRQAVAITLGQSFDDWQMSQIATALGRTEDAKLFAQRALNYRNVFRKEKGFMWPRNAKGDWIEPFDTRFAGGMGARDYFTENNAWTYNFCVQHDIGGLSDLMGGREELVRRLDGLFNAPTGKPKYEYFAQLPDSTGLVGQFVMGNEPSFHIPYLYAHAGAAWKTQRRVRSLLSTWFRDDLHGICGDEDGGGTTAFYVFSALGFYPVTPGVAVYTIGSPIFETAKVQLSDGKVFEVRAVGNSLRNVYIQSATLNGQPLKAPFITHAQVTAGGVLELKMSNEPNVAWGAGVQPGKLGE